MKRKNYRTVFVEPDDEGNTDKAKRINMDFSMPPPNIMPPLVQMPQQPMPPPMPPPMTMLPPSAQSEAYYYNMNNLNGPWRGRNNRAVQSYGYNIRGGQNMWTRPRGSGPNQRNNYRVQTPYSRGGGLKGNSQYNQQSFYQNQGYTCSNNYNNGAYSNFMAQGQGVWQVEGFPVQDDGSSIGGKKKAQSRPLTPSSNGSSDMEMAELSGGGGNTKSKRRSMSQSYPSRPWDREAAEKALATELEFLKALRNQNLIIKFPDPELNKDVVKAFHPNIVNVHFQVPSGPRFCFVQLEEGADADKVMQALSNCAFGNGKLQVEKRDTKKDENLCPETIDPLTLYVGNLPSTISKQTLFENFPPWSRIDIGHAQRMKNTRYAFIRYDTAEAALDAFRKTHNLQLENRSVIVRFRRHKATSTPPQNSEKKIKTSDMEGSKHKKKVAAAVASVPKPASVSSVSNTSAVDSDSLIRNLVKAEKDGDSDDDDDDKSDEELVLKGLSVKEQQEAVRVFMLPKEADEDDENDDSDEDTNEDDDDSDEDEEDEEEEEDEEDEEESEVPVPGANGDDDDDDSSDDEPEEYDDDDDD